MDFVRPATQIDTMSDFLCQSIPTLGIRCEVVSHLIRTVATNEIMSRYGRLPAQAIRAKRPGEIVTEADLAVERSLATKLMDLVPDAIIVGEEEVEDSPGLLGRLNEAAPVFVLDPVDGTRNFANGEACFAVIVAFRRQGETLAGWIYNPVDDEMCVALSGKGACFDSDQPIVRATGTRIDRLRGCLDRRAVRAMGGRPGTAKPGLVPRYRCVGREYMDLCAGRLDFVQFGQRLKPWDHLAGVLVAREAGFHVAMTQTGAPYAPGETGIVNGNLLIAPDIGQWNLLCDLTRAG